MNTNIITAPVLIGLLSAALVACSGGRSSDPAGATRSAEAPARSEVFEGPVARADCGPGSQIETDLQGRVSIEDRESGRSEAGYSCNLELVGQSQGKGASWQMAWYEDCAYYGTAFPGQAGVQIIQVEDPTNPQNVGALTSPAMLDPWESLKVNEKRGLLGADAGWNVAGLAYFDVYDLNGDCATPDLMASVPAAVPVGHEGEWAPDGKTYYVGVVHSAIDVTDAHNPRLIPQTETSGSGHGLSVSDDGTRMYGVNGSCGNGLVIYDTSAVQARTPNPTMPVVGEVCWEDGSTAQHTIPIFYDDKPYIVFVDEGGKGAARIIDISDETQPRVVSKLKLEIHMPDADEEFATDCAEGLGFCYEGHYCNVDRFNNPTALACGYFMSGVRVFDIRNPMQPREIAYYNPPAQIDRGAELTSSEHANGLLSAGGPDLRADWCSAQVRMIPERGELWTTCQDNGFMVLRFTNGVWPFE